MTKLEVLCELLGVTEEMLENVFYGRATMEYSHVRSISVKENSRYRELKQKLLDVIKSSQETEEDEDNIQPDVEPVKHTVDNESLHHIEKHVGNAETEHIVEPEFTSRVQKTALNESVDRSDDFIIKDGDNFMDTTKKVAPNFHKEFAKDMSDVPTYVDEAVEEYSKSIDAEIEQLEKEEQVVNSWSAVATPAHTASVDPWTPYDPNQEKTEEKGSEKEIQKAEEKKVKSTADPDWMHTSW